MRILVTGRDGQVGMALAQALPSIAEVSALGRSALDLRDPQAIRARIAEARPDVIVNAAAFTAVDRAEDERETAFAVNATAVGHIGEAARGIGALVVHFSTDYVFDGAKAAPYVEEDRPAPLSVYGASKLEGERLLAASGCRHFIFRTTWVYASAGRNFVHAILAAARDRPELRVVNDQHGAPTAAGDLAAAVRTVLANRGHAGRTGLYHLCSAGETTWYEFAREILRAKGIATPVVPIRSEEFPAKARRPKNSRLDCAKAARDLGVTLPGWRDGLAAVLRDLA